MQEKKTVTNDKSNVKGRSKANERKTKFSPGEVEQMPKSALFPLPLGCSLCVYQTKVRSNLIRHVLQHATGDSVSLVDVINPVPQKSEKMFDKMMNLAVSSHKKVCVRFNFYLELFVFTYHYIPGRTSIIL